MLPDDLVPRLAKRFIQLIYADRWSGTQASYKVHSVSCRGYIAVDVSWKKWWRLTKTSDGPKGNSEALCECFLVPWMRPDQNIRPCPSCSEATKCMFYWNYKDGLIESILQFTIVLLSWRCKVIIDIMLRIGFLSWATTCVLSCSSRVPPIDRYR